MCNGGDLFEGTVRLLVSRVFDISSFANSRLFPFIVIPYVIGIVFICMSFDGLMSPLLGAIVTFISNGLSRMYNRINLFVNRFLNKI